MDEQGWLRAVQVVDTSTVGDESEQLQFIHEVLKGGVDQVVEFGLDETLNNPETVPVIYGLWVSPALGLALRLTDFPETTTGDDEGVVQGNERALTSNAIAKGRIVGVPDELRPVTVDDARPGLDKRVLDVIEEGGIGIEIGKSRRLQFEAFAGKVRIDELFHSTNGRVGAVDRSKVCQNLTGRLVGRFVDKGLWVRVQLSDVDSLEELGRS